MEWGYADFSMRSVAKAAGVRLANLQYYFPKKEDLIRALIGYVGELYDSRYLKQLERAGAHPLARFKGAIEFNLDDIFCRKTRHFFIQFWPLIAIVDDYSGKLLHQFYLPQLRQLQALVDALHPGLDDIELRRRAEMIAALIEGLMVVTLPPEKQHEESFRKDIVRQCLAIAAGCPP